MYRQRGKCDIETYYRKSMPPPPTKGQEIEGL